MTGANPGDGSPRGQLNPFPLLHGILALGAIVIVGAFVAISRMAPPPSPGLTTPLRIAGGIEFLTVVVVTKLVTSQIEPLAAGEDAARWWATYGARALVLWAMAEGTAVIGAVFWYLSRDLPLLLVLAGFGIGALPWMRPGRLLSG